MEDPTMTAKSSTHPLDSIFAPFGAIFSGTVPPVRNYEVYSEEDGTVVLEVELPGCEAGEVKVETECDELRIEASHEDSRRKYEFNKAFTLDENLDHKKVEAELKGGILKIRLPRKKAKKTDVKTITVTT
jgi:HSP20 family molecular chaperone IbpA